MSGLVFPPEGVGDPASGSCDQVSLAKDLVRVGRYVFWSVTAASLLWLGGCGQKLSSAEALAAFEKAGPIQPAVDVERLIKAKIPAGPYHVVTGDVLELQIPAAVSSVAAEARDKVRMYLCRVDDAGMVRLPLIGQIESAGKTLAKIELDIAAAYHPKYVKDPPSVVARVVEYRTAAVSIVGAVEEPGLYRLQSDEMSLVALLMKAGGIAKDGAAIIRIRLPGGPGKAKELVLPVKGTSIPFADVALEGGEFVEVERLDLQVFAVMGLVNKANTFPYQPGARYNLMQAIAFAGGINNTADPKYVKIYRQDAEGQVVAATFKISGEHLPQAARVRIKPGDIIAVQHTARTRTRMMLAGVFRTGIYAGASYNLNPSSGR